MNFKLAAIAMFAGTAAFGQATATDVITRAAEALGGKEKILAVKTLVIEGSGINPNVGQNPLPDSPLLNWNVPEFKRSLDLANGRMRVEQHRIAAFDFALATDVHQNMGLDGSVAFNVNPDGTAQRAGDAAAADRRIEMLGNPIVDRARSLRSRREGIESAQEKRRAESGYHHSRRRQSDASREREDGTAGVGKLDEFQ